MGVTTATAPYKAQHTGITGSKEKPGAKPGEAVGSQTQQGGNATVANRHGYVARRLWQHDGAP